MKKWRTRWKLASILGITALLLAAGCDEFQESSSSGGGEGFGSQGEGGGFVWKPVGENSGRLVILLPPQYTGQAASVVIKASDKSLLEVGTFTGVGNGNRMHFRFSQRGGHYGQNLYVVAEMNDGNTLHWIIPNGAHRCEY